METSAATALLPSAEPLAMRLTYIPPQPALPPPWKLMLSGALCGAASLLALRALPQTAGWLWTFALGMAAVVLVMARRSGATGALPAVMALLGAVVAVRWLMLGASHGALEQAAPLAGGLMGAFAWSGWHSSQKAPTARVVEGRWAALLARAREAQALLSSELQQHAGMPECTLLHEGSSRLLDVVGQASAGWSRLERGASETLMAAVEGQLADVNARLAGAEADTVTRAEWERMASSLGAQMESIRHIRRAADRALARVECEVMQLQTARLGVMAWAAQDASIRGPEAARLTAMMEQARADLELTAGAMEDAQRALAGA